MNQHYCYYDSEKNRCKCGATKGAHALCKMFLPTNNGRPCAHLRSDHDGGCDNAYAQFEAYANSIKKEGTTK